MIINQIVSGGGSPAAIPGYYVKREVDGNGKLVCDSTQTTISTYPATDVGDYGLGGWRNGLAIQTIETVDCSSLTQISGNNAFQYAFLSANPCDFDFSNVTTISGDFVFFKAFMYASLNNTSEIEFTSLTSITGGYVFEYAFAEAGDIYTVTFPALTSAGNDAFVLAFASDKEDGAGLYCPISTVDFSVLQQAGNNCFMRAFKEGDLYEIEFPALTSAGNSCFSYAFENNLSIGSVTFGGTSAITLGTDVFDSMFDMCSQDIDVYAPAANQAAIEAMTGYPSFGCTGTVTWHWQS